MAKVRGAGEAENSYKGSVGLSNARGVPAVYMRLHIPISEESGHQTGD